MHTSYVVRKSAAVGLLDVSDIFISCLLGGGAKGGGVPAGDRGFQFY